MRRLSPRAIRLQLSWINGPWFDRIVLRWQRSSAPPSEPLDFFSLLNSVQRVLIVPNDRVGGLFLGAPICKLVRQSYPRAHIGLLVDRTKAVIARQIPFVDEVVTRTGVGLDRFEVQMLYGVRGPELSKSPWANSKTVSWTCFYVWVGIAVYASPICVALAERCYEWGSPGRK